MENYKSWQPFVFQGVKFIALEYQAGPELRIFDFEMNNYGSYMDIKNFKEFYKKEKEDLILGNHLKD